MPYRFVIFPLTFFALFFLGCGDDATTAQAPPPTPANVPEGMVYIAHPETPFFMDATEVTVGEFAEFIEATGYVTEADSFGWSGVFDRVGGGWLPVEGANWKYPLGPDSTAAAPNEPVTQVSLKDARTYAEWAGTRLPSEEEWNYAASQGGRETEYPWGDEMTPNGEYLGNWWQGYFPLEDRVEDGFAGVAPVKSFPPADNGLYDISGNVWEWTTSPDPGRQQYVIRGGSYLCSTSYCTGFNLRQRQYTPADSGLNHLGFRTVKDA